MSVEKFFSELGPSLMVCVLCSVVDSDGGLGSD